VVASCPSGGLVLLDAKSTLLLTGSLQACLRRVATEVEPVAFPSHSPKAANTRWPLSPVLGNTGVPRAKARRIDDPSNTLFQHCGGPPDQRWHGRFGTVIAVGRMKGALGHGAISSSTHEEDRFGSADRQQAPRAASVEKTALKKCI
jgi:hypothetical protein